MPNFAGRMRWLQGHRFWISFRKVTQYCVLILFVIAFVEIQSGNIRPYWSSLPFLLDPLLQFSFFLSSRILLTGSLLAIFTLLSALIFGRAWCGWICPLGTVLDMFNRVGIGKKSPQIQIPEKIRSAKYLFLTAIIFAALLGNLTLLAFDPITVMFRTLTFSFWPGLEFLWTRLISILYYIPFLQPLINSLEQVLRPGIFPYQPRIYPLALFMGIFFIGIVGLNFLARRFWCRYICPLGGLLAVFSKLALIRRHVSEYCSGCDLCSKVCPTGAINPNTRFSSNPAECTFCLDCLPACRRGATSFAIKLSVSNHQEYEPGRRQFLTTMGTTFLALIALNYGNMRLRDWKYRLLPPGSSTGEFLSKCIRCSQCMQSCPTSALQPSWMEASISDLWTPLLTPRRGYCDYACNACGSVCPTQAIPKLSLEEKRMQVIGKAIIDPKRCIAWADHQECIVCEEMCPLPEKAILLETKKVTDEDAEIYSIQLPHVELERCIGCGICEYKCPVPTEAAIRVISADLIDLVA